MWKEVLMTADPHNTSYLDYSEDYDGSYEYPNYNYYYGCVKCVDGILEPNYIHESKDNWCECEDGCAKRLAWLARRGSLEVKTGKPTK
jgi:hypothetical protein